MSDSANRDSVNSDSSNQASGQPANLSMTKLLTLPSPQRRILRHLLKQNGLSLAQLADWLEEDETATGQILASFIAKGWVKSGTMKGEKIYQVRLAPKAGLKKIKSRQLFPPKPDQEPPSDPQVT